MDRDSRGRSGAKPAKRALRRLAVVAERAETERRPGYRVEHRTPGKTVVIAHLPTAAAHPSELDRFAVRLRHEGQAAGRLVLIEEGSGRVVAQRALWGPIRAWYRTPPRTPSRAAPRRLVPLPSPPASPHPDRDRTHS